MKKIFLLCLLFAFATSTYAQKKLTPVKQSALTGIGLPNGSKQDGRILSVSSATTLLEMESSKANTTLRNTEVFTLAPASVNKFNKDSLVQRLSSRSWKIIVAEGDYLWLKKDSRYVIAYFSINTKETSLYFAEATAVPNLAVEGNNTINNQPAVSPIVQPIPQPTTQTVTQPVSQPQQNNNTNTNASASNGKFAFSTTNFDDGWISTVQEDWVQVVKGNTKVLIHYPNKDADAYNSVMLDALKNSWNILVAPKYSSASNFEFKPINSWQSIEFAEADAIEKTSGKSVHVVLFKMDYFNGSGKYLEFITPDKKSFEQEFGAYHETSSGWEKMESMANYNKFAVAATDLKGKWTNDFSGMVQYVNAYTGADAGANTHASNESFEFMADNTYKWDLGVASGMVGNIKFQSAKSNGKFSLPNNWQLALSDIEGKPRTYNVFFSCVKGARILWLDDRGFGRIE